MQRRREGWTAVAAIALGLVAVLAVASTGYGFHRDELYFIEAAHHPALGFPDQPPLTPLLGALGTALPGHTPAALRIPSDLVAAAGVVLAALIASRLGGR